MAYCSSCWLNYVMRIVNLVINLLGIGMIVYSLCLLKIWREGMADFGPTASSNLKPWFIYALLGVGMVVCFGVVLGYTVSNSVSTKALSIYILVIVGIIFLQTTVIVSILFRVDWQTVISKYLDGRNNRFESSLKSHLSICRLLGITILLAQVKVLALAIVLWALGPRPRSHCRNGPTVPEVRYSFLVVRSDSPPTLPTLVSSFITRYNI